MSELEAGYFQQLTAAGIEVIQGDYRAASRIFELTREGQCPEPVGELAEVLGMMIVKVEAREHGLERALNEVRKKNADLERASELRAEFGMLFSGTILLLSVYAMSVSFLRGEAHLNMGPRSMATQMVNLGLFAALGLMMVSFLRKHHYPFSTFGLTLRNWERSLLESLAACIPVFVALLLYKRYLIAADPAFAGHRLLAWDKWEPWEMFVIYLFVTAAQELSTRGFQLTCIERLLTGRRRMMIAILLGAAQFAVVHLHYSFRLGVMAFLGAVLFGSLYARHRTIVGITVAHYVLGQFIFGPLELLN